MNTARYISLNGRSMAPEACADALRALLQTNYTYRMVHTRAEVPLHISTQLQLLELSYAALFRREARFDRQMVRRSITDLLYRNNASPGSNLLKIAAAPDIQTSEPCLWIFYEHPLMYPGYNTWHKSAAAAALTYEIPFPAFKTAASLMCHRYARDYIAADGCTEVISVNYKGEAVSLGENPLFAVQGRNVYVADGETTTPQSVERLLGIRLCEGAGFTVNEAAVAAPSLADMDELFAFTPQGLLPVGRVDGRLCASTLVRALEDKLPALMDTEPL